MVNNDRIVPITKIDYLSMIGTVLVIAGVSAATLAATDIDGDFSVTEAGTFLADQPVKSLEIAEGVTSGTVYFTAGYDFDDITVAGTTATIADGSVSLDDIKKDTVTLYKAVLADGEITITAVTPSLE